MMMHRLQSIRHSATGDGYRLLLLAAMALYVVIFAGLAFDLHNGMRTHRSDLGQIAQAVWNSSRGRFVEMTDNGFVATRMTDHVEPLLALISPVLWLWEDVRALLLLQVVLVAVGAWPLYALALRRLDTLLTPRERAQIWQVEPLRQLTRPLALVLALAYLLTPQLQSAVLTEFHAGPLAVPLILWAFWAIDAKRPWQMAIAILLIAITKEEMALLAAGLGVWAWWRSWLARAADQPAKFGWSARVARWLPPLLIVLSLLWFYVATFVIVPAHALQVYDREQSIYFERYGALGDSPLDIVKSMVTRPQLFWQIATEPARLAYLWGLLAPFGLLSLLAPEILLLALPLLLANLLSTYPAQYYGDFHYSAPLVPYVAVAAVYGLARLWRWIGRHTSRSSASYQHLAAADSGVMALVSFLTNARTALRPIFTFLLALWLLTWATITYLHNGRGPLAAQYDTVTSATTYTHARLLPYFLAQIPSDAAVTATAAVHPHVSLRRYVYQFPLGLPELETAGLANWALLDVTTNTDMAPGDLKSAVERLLAGEWGVVDGADGFLLLQRGASQKQIPPAFYDFARTSAPPDETPSPTTALVKTGVITWPRWRQAKIQATWQVGADAAQAPPAPTLQLVTPDGELIDNLTTAAPPALIWYPPARWQPGEQITITTLPLWLPRLWGLTTATTAVAPTMVDAVSADGQAALVNVLISADGGVAELPLPPGTPPLSEVQRLNNTTVNFVGADDARSLSLHAWGTPQTVTPGDNFLLWLRWAGTQWPAHQTVFVHLRAGDQNVAQRDGLPRFFVPLDPTDTLARRGMMDDVRSLAIPTTVAPGTQLTLVVGLYDQITGQRTAIVDRMGTPLGEEWVVGEYAVVAPPVPDQACALIPASCATQ
jgi:uncharacterized membrane protein